MTILLIGCGRMGGALARRWSSGERVMAFDPDATLPDGVERVANLDDVSGESDLVVVLAVKPQTFPALAPALRRVADCRPLILSIMAGVPLSALAAPFGGSGRVVRAMPNTPAAIGRGISGLVAGQAVSSADRDRAGGLLGAVGEVVWLATEGDIDLVTAISGSGPAYVFRMTEALAAAGVRLGLAEPVATRLASATLTGAAALVEAESCALADLRRQVTSPGGTTAAGLAQMDEDAGIDDLMARVAQAAARRSVELADQGVNLVNDPD
ncbi:pyrroline-5-carboxylate reductase [Sphingomonas gellani]|uniref:Pyrroline-5-carboxylate reductase n=1 Tax=Sphingomonas gellani TaxID=1166340 RepID=A0A1H8ATG4_9SPHN|nr:pyrroline-5-carboxylate reductase [Sphingomonas gellani]SEM73995.1 pyrroline-5-carboxylate reductase [Sphingomonas gellani]